MLSSPYCLVPYHLISFHPVVLANLAVVEDSVVLLNDAGIKEGPRYS